MTEEAGDAPASVGDAWASHGDAPASDRDAPASVGDALASDAGEGSASDQAAPPDMQLADPEAGHDRARFTVHLTNFEGPFDLLLQLISKHKLDVTEVSLSKVTDDFIAHIRRDGDSWNLAQATEFLLVAATLLDLKTARLLPRAEVDDEEDLALLEARDLLFARLLQYRAYKQVASAIAEMIRTAGRRYPRGVSLEPRYAEALPELLIGVGPERFARIAERVMTPKEPETVRLDHLHAAQVSVGEQMSLMRERLARRKQLTFRELTEDCTHTLEVVARFLGLLELYRDKAVMFEQVAPLGDLNVRWCADDTAEPRPPAHDPDEEYA
ncbi:segregation and condensation protein A [Cumulibacter manganitolerans]|uniref:segregation and condensation protein A n=1 Tax=Cumulibacter manganitolerans TaxID=1884992 RepID=UPI001E4A5696|nr:segregation/condensation protein A [Cumulibacter manganitolerans]